MCTEENNFVFSMFKIKCQIISSLASVTKNWPQEKKMAKAQIWLEVEVIK